MIVFKDEAQKAEFARLDNRLQTILIYLSGLAEHLYHKSVVITHLWRTQEGQDEIYKGNAVYQSKPWVSVHQVGRGADIRSDTYTPAEINNLVSELNSTFEYGGGKQTAICHDVGHGQHFHIQVPDRGGRQHFL